MRSIPIVLLALLAARADACTVPVFRYALERWPADDYEAVVFHRGPLDEESRALIAAFEKRAEEASANLVVRTADLESAELDPELARVWKSEVGRGEPSGEPGLELPHLVLRFPRGVAPFDVLWHAKLDRSSVDTVIDSPLRRQVRDRLVAGDTAAWIFIPSGDEKADGAAWKTLETELRRLEREIELPEILASDLELVGMTREDEARLKIAFPLFRLERSEVAESAFLAMLLRCEPGLLPRPDALLRPMALPIFGRGRVLYALVAGGIHPGTIEEAARFLTGPCSCQVKEKNPGVDLLLDASWDELVTVTPMADRPPPELTGIDGFVAIRDLTGAGARSEVPPASDSALTGSAPLDAGGLEAAGLDAVEADAAPEPAQPPPTATSSAPLVATAAEVRRAETETAATGAVPRSAADEPEKETDSAAEVEEPDPGGTGLLLRNAAVAVAAAIVLVGLAALIGPLSRRRRA